MLLIWIGIKLLMPESSDNGHQIDAGTTLLGAIKTIIIADTVMSLDNVIGIAGAAKGDIGLVVFGLLVSVPIIVWGSKFVMKLMTRFPVTIVIGAGLLGWIAGDMSTTDTVTKVWIEDNAAYLRWVAPIVTTLIVIMTGKWLATRAVRKTIVLTEMGGDNNKSV